MQRENIQWYFVTAGKGNAIFGLSVKNPPAPLIELLPKLYFQYRIPCRKAWTVTVPILGTFFEQHFGLLVNTCLQKHIGFVVVKKITLCSESNGLFNWVLHYLLKWRYIDKLPTMLKKNRIIKKLYSSWNFRKMCFKLDRST